jgi:hypothetical protein
MKVCNNCIIPFQNRTLKTHLLRTTRWAVLLLEKDANCTLAAAATRDACCTPRTTGPRLFTRTATDPCCCFIAAARAPCWSFMDAIVCFGAWLIANELLQDTCHLGV